MRVSIGKREHSAPSKVWWQCGARYYDHMNFPKKSLGTQVPTFTIKPYLYDLFCSWPWGGVPNVLTIHLLT
jgi:hypothetical protein